MIWFLFSSGSGASGKWQAQKGSLEEAQSVSKTIKRHPSHSIINTDENSTQVVPDSHYAVKPSRLREIHELVKVGLYSASCLRRSVVVRGTHRLPGVIDLAEQD